VSLSAECYRQHDGCDDERDAAEEIGTDPNEAAEGAAEAQPSY
jgi:hypothetical protein